MQSKIYSAAILGIDAMLVEVEIDTTPGLHSFNVVGLPDKAVEESKDRINSSIKNCGLESPRSKNWRIVVNLAPADVKKAGPHYDLPIAVAYLSASGQIKANLESYFFVGELSLSGAIRHTNGILAMVELAKRKGFTKAFIPYPNLAEASFVSGIDIFGVKDLKVLVDYMHGTADLEKADGYYKPIIENKSDNYDVDLVDIKGQSLAKRALEVAAAGSHNILLVGSPGSGKTMLAKSLPSILPDLTNEESLEVTKIYSAAHLLSNTNPIINKRQMRSPHHTTSSVALVGGGVWPKPGEVSLAHRGVLFLDELPEFNKNTLEALRQPLEDGVISVSRANGSIRFPCRFALVGSLNLCPCGNAGDEVLTCTCSPSLVTKYQRKISGPFLDRVDMLIHVKREKISATQNNSLQEFSHDVKKRVVQARQIQLERFKGGKIYANSEMNTRDLKKYGLMTDEAQKFVTIYVDSKNLSFRSYTRIVKLARTIADLDHKEIIDTVHLTEAVNFRLDNNAIFS